MVKNNKQIKNIYFFDAGYGVRGGANYVIALIKHLCKMYTDINIGVIDFLDGYIPEKLKDYKIKLINYTDSEWDIEPNSVIFCPAERLCLLKPLKNSDYRDSIKIITIVWETKIAWGCLYPPSHLRRFANLLYETNSIMFMDLGCKIATESKYQLNRKFKPNYLPLYFRNDTNIDLVNKNIINENEYNVAWLGRLSDSKCFSLLNLIKKYNNIKTDKRKRLHIIGDGLYRETLEKRIEKIENLDVEIIFKGILKDRELYGYLINNTDILFAMGTAMLNGASLHLPVAGVSETGNSKLDLDKFIWLFNEEGLQLGLPDTKNLINKINPKAQTLQTILNEIYCEFKKEDIGELCYQYYSKTYTDIDSIVNTLFEYINNSNLTYKNLYRLFKELPFVNILHTNVVICKIPLFQIIRKRCSTIYKFLGIRFLKRIKYGKYGCKYKLFGLFTILKIETIGRFNFPNIFSKKLNKQ